MRKKHRNIQTSVLDMLIDNEPGNSNEPVQYRLVDFSQIMASVRRDLEMLLNSRRNIITPPATCKEVGNSLFVYGLPDFTAKNPATVAAGYQLRMEIEKTISRFEPRLKDVKVIVDTPQGQGRHIKFRISGILKVEPLAEPVTFDTNFDANRSKYSISK